MTSVVEKVDAMTGTQKIIFTCLFVVGISLTTAFGIWWFQPSHISHNWVGWAHTFDYLLFLLLTYIVWHQIVMEIFAWYMASEMKHPKQTLAPEENLRVAYLTAFVPGAEPYDMLEKTLEAMTQVSYPHDTWLLDEGDDPAAKSICEKYGVMHYSRKGKKCSVLPAVNLRQKPKEEIITHGFTTMIRDMT